MKPLELTIYDKHPDADAYRIGGAYQPYAIVGVDKRFTGAELAAEYWMLCYFISGANYNEASSGESYSDEFWDRQYARLEVTHRLATLPHASDNGYE